MLLSKEEIESFNLLTNTNSNNFNSVSYDLSAKEIITLENQIVNEYILPPQGMVYLVSKEEFNLENQPVVGFTTVKNSLSRLGIMAVNIGLVDPGYVGPISSILINFGKRPIPLKEGDTFLRMTFHKFNHETNISKSINNTRHIRKDYIKRRQDEANNYLGAKFLYLEDIQKNLEDIQKKASERSKEEAITKAKEFIANYEGNIKTALQIVGIPLAIIGLLVSVFFNLSDYRQSKLNNEQILELQKKLEVIQHQSSKNEVKSDSIIIK